MATRSSCRLVTEMMRDKLDPRRAFLLSLSAGALEELKRSERGELGGSLRTGEAG